MSFLSKLKSSYSKFTNWLKNAFKKNDEFAKKYAPIAINVVNWIKDFNDSEGADLIEVVCSKALGKYGKAVSPMIPVVRKWLAKELPLILDGLKLTDEVANAVGVQAKSAAAMKAIDAMTDIPDKADIYAKIARKLAEYLATDGRIDYNEAMSIIHIIYATCANKDNKLA